jgi:hypothetical protein
MSNAGFQVDEERRHAVFRAFRRDRDRRRRTCDDHADGGYAAFVDDFLATPRTVGAPVQEAVTRPIPPPAVLRLRPSDRSM